MPALLHEGAQRAGGERRQIDRHQLRGDAAADEGHQPGILRRRHRLGQQPQREAREILAALAVAQPVGDERAEIDLPQFGFDRGGFEEMHLDEFAELVGDAVLVALDDRGVRDRQPQRPLEQRHHGVPVGEAADGGGLGKRRDEAERRDAPAATPSRRGKSQTSPPAPSVASNFTRRSSAARAASPGVSMTKVAGRLMTAFEWTTDPHPERAAQAASRRMRGIGALDGSRRRKSASSP